MLYVKLTKLAHRRRFGFIDAFVTHPDGKTFFRIDDVWMPADMCELVE